MLFSFPLTMRDGHICMSPVTACISRLAGDRVNAACSGSGAFSTQFEVAVIHDDGIVHRVAIAIATCGSLDATETSVTRGPGSKVSLTTTVTATSKSL